MLIAQANGVLNDYLFPAPPALINSQSLFLPRIKHNTWHETLILLKNSTLDFLATNFASAVVNCTENSKSGEA